MRQEAATTKVRPAVNPPEASPMLDETKYSASPQVFCLHLTGWLRVENYRRMEICIIFGRGREDFTGHFESFGSLVDPKFGK